MTTAEIINFPVGEPSSADLIDLQASETIPEGWVARQFADHYGGSLAYCHGHKAWFRYDGSIWRQQQTPIAYHLAHKLAARMSVTAKNVSKMQSAAYAGGVERLCQADPVFSRTANQWDPNIWLGGVPFGAVDLKSGDLRRATPDDMITKSFRVDPSPFQDCPEWFRFLREATADNDELIRFLQQICGYSLTGDISEQQLFFIYGPGGNGKGVFLKVLQEIMNDYSVIAAKSAFAEKKGNANTNDIAMFRGARLVSASETKKGARWDVDLLQQLTGEDVITARFLYANFFSFLPQFTLLMIGNFKPEIESITPAIKRRMNLIEFGVIPKNKDPNLIHKLRPEYPGILRWMIDGCLDWQANGLIRPDIVRVRTDEYFEDQDTLSEWVATCCDVDMGNTYVNDSASVLYKSWKSFAISRDVSHGSAKTFKDDMERLGFKRRRTSAGWDYLYLTLRRQTTLNDD